MTDWPANMPKPTWESKDGSVLLYHADCLDILPQLPDGCVDAVVTDPPYGIGWKPRVNHQDQVWRDSSRIDPTPLLRVGNKHVIWGGNYIADLLPASESWLTWIKRPVHCDFSSDHRTYATTEMAWSDVGKARFIVHVWDGGMRAGDVDNRTFCHPSQKPLEVMMWCIPDGDGVVFDAYMGSGTTGVACVRLSRRFIGIEIERKYFDIAVRRIEEAFDSQALFRQDEQREPDPELFEAANDSAKNVAVPESNTANERAKA